jgi:tetratricopeptide (TPR) repeat protein/mono/diheme cytochrome c family protein
VSGVAAVLLAGACDAPVDDARAAPEHPVFSADVAQILHARCAQCHRPEGAAPFPLLSYDDARARAELIAVMTTSRRMPPWLPEPTDHPFADERRLTEREITTLARWAAQGAPIGDAAAVPAPPAFPAGWALGEPDLIVAMDEPYTVPAEGPDVFRNFVVPIPLAAPRYVRAVELQPGDPQVVHHVVLAVDPTPLSREEAALDPEPGFEGMFTRASARPPTGFFVGWTPGLVPRPNPEGLAWRVEPGTDLVIQMHLRPHGHATSVRARVAFFFTDQPPMRTPVLVRLGSQTLDIPAGAQAYTVTDSVRLPVAVSLLGLYPHAHYLGRTMELQARLPNGRVRQLLRIDDWDFDWQDAYTFAEPVELAAGSTLHMRFTYDNSAANPRNPHSPPRRVVYGPHSTDEMAELWIQAVAANEAELPALQQELTRKSARDRVEGWQHLIRLDPRDAIAHANLAAHRHATGDIDAAIRHYRFAIDAEPGFAQAQYNLGLLLESRGELDEAAGRFEAAIRARPSHAGAHTSLGNVRFAQGRHQEAARHFRRAIEADAAHVEAHNNLGSLLRAEGRHAEAIEHYRRVLELVPDSPPARFNLALALAAHGRADEALAEFRRAPRSTASPLVLEAHLALAWILATHHSAAARRPDDALAIAEQAARLLGSPHPLVLDVAAAAYAAGARYLRAAEIATEALRLAEAAGQADLADAIRGRLQLYRAGRPYVEPPGGADGG